MKIYKSIYIVLTLFLASSLMLPGLGKDPFSQTKFIPGISFIMDFSYMRRNLDNETFVTLHTPGIFALHGHNEEHAHGSAGNGFNFNYGELVLFAAVDPYFDLFTTFHLSEGDFEIEEAYVTSRRLPWGLGLKIGKFLSSFGRINAQHAHNWDFMEKPLVHLAIFGAEGLSEKGIQLNWVAPTDFFLTLGVETLQGTNENSFGTEGFHVINATTAEELDIAETPLPNLWTFFGKTSVETGNLVTLAGVSYATGLTRVNLLEDEHEPHAFSGTTGIFGVDVYAKYIIDSHRYLSFQGEYLARKITGWQYNVLNNDLDGFKVERLPMTKKQAGGYAQLIYRFHKTWRLGVRWETLQKNALADNLNRYSVMLDYSPTEFSRIRLQYNRNQFQFIGDKRKDYNEFVLQFNVAIGAHGAHAF